MTVYTILARGQVQALPLVDNYVGMCEERVPPAVDMLHTLGQDAPGQEHTSLQERGTEEHDAKVQVDLRGWACERTS